MKKWEKKNKAKRQQKVILTFIKATLLCLVSHKWCCTYHNTQGAVWSIKPIPAPKSAIQSASTSLSSLSLNLVLPYVSISSSFEYIAIYLYFEVIFCSRLICLHIFGMWDKSRALRRNTWPGGECKQFHPDSTCAQVWTLILRAVRL